MRGRIYSTLNTLTDRQTTLAHAAHYRWKRDIIDGSHIFSNDVWPPWWFSLGLSLERSVHDNAVSVLLSDALSFAHALHKGQVCGGGCLMNALPGRAFTALRMKEHVGGSGQRHFYYNSEAMVKWKMNLFPFVAQIKTASDVIWQIRQFDLEATLIEKNISKYVMDQH